MDPSSGTQQENQPQASQSPPRNDVFRSLALFRVGFMQALVVVAGLVIVFAILDYFKILQFSSFLFKQQNKTSVEQSQSQRIPASLPLEEQGEQLISQVKQTLNNFLPSILSSSVLPQSSSAIAFTQNEGIKESFSTRWDTPEGTISAIMVTSATGTDFSQIYLSLLKPETEAPTAELAQTTTSQFFSIEPKGKWGCKPIYENTMTFCENFWEEDGTRLGVGIIGVSGQGDNMVFFCQHNKDSKLYSWKSCQNEFAETGVVN